jgi:hypothetical protein
MTYSVYQHWNLVEDFQPLLSILPGANKKIIGISSQFPVNILKMLDQLTDPVDTVLLTNGDVWRYFDAREEIFNHPNLQDKNVFLQTLGYTNTKINARCWEISYPVFHWKMQKSRDPFVAKSSGFKHGFSCLNNTNNIHRTLLGYNLYNNNLLNDIIFSQNIVNDGYAITRISQDANILNLENFEEYKNLLPIRYNELLHPELNFARDHSINHDAYTKAYCNIVTESECEEYPYNRNINLPVITEKSYKPFRSGQVPIMFAARGHIAYLKSLGFEMMEDLMPVGYDQMNTPQKISTIVAIVSKGKDLIEDFYFNHLREIKHNYELFNSTKVEELVIKRIKDIM